MPSCFSGTKRFVRNPFKKSNGSRSPTPDPTQGTRADDGRSSRQATTQPPSPARPLRPIPDVGLNDVGGSQGRPPPPTTTLLSTPPVHTHPPPPTSDPLPAPLVLSPVASPNQHPGSTPTLRSGEQELLPRCATPKLSSPADLDGPMPPLRLPDQIHEGQGPNSSALPVPPPAPTTQVSASSPLPKTDAPPPSVPSSPPVAPLPEPTKQRKTFTSSGDYKKDITVLQTIYVLQENSDLKQLALTLIHIQENDKDKELTQAINSCADFTARLASLVRSHPGEVGHAVKEFHSIIAKIKPTSGKGGHQRVSPEDVVKDTIAKIEEMHPLLGGGVHKKPSQEPSKIVDITLAVTIPALEIFKEASVFIPVGMVQPLVSIVVGLLKAVEQTRTNFSDMQRIVETAGQFVVSLAVDCSKWTEAPSPQFGNALDELKETFIQIARDCDGLSHRHALVRFFQQGVDKSEVAKNKDKLDAAIKLFMARCQIGLHFDLQTIERKIDEVAQAAQSAALRTLPEHPERPLNMYLAGSRGDVIKEINDWLEDPTKSVFWLHGAAGLGKSTIAQEVIDLLRSNGRLASFVLLPYVSSDNRPPAKVIQMISRMLGSLHQQAAPSIAEAIGQCSSIAAHPLEQFLSMYIVNPVQALGYPRPLVIVIDALDEWENERCQKFLESLAHLPSPSPVKFIMTSRPLEHLILAFRRLLPQEYPLPAAPTDVVQRYFDDRFGPQCLKPIQWGKKQPTEKDVEQLVDLANGSLIWAATVCALLLRLERRSPYEILHEILGSKERVTAQKASPLRILYQHAVGQLFPDTDEQEMLRDFLGDTIVLQEPLPIDDFKRLVGYDVDGVRQRLSALQTRGELGGDLVLPAAQLFHASFLEFMHDPTLPFLVGDDEAHLRTATNCISLIVSQTTRAGRDQLCIHSGLDGAGRYAVRFLGTHLTSLSHRDILGKLDELQMWATLIVPCSLHKSWDRMEPESLVIPETCTLYTQGTLIGLDEAVLAHKKVTDLMPADHPALSSLNFVNTVAATLFSRFEYEGTMEDLDDAISWYQKGLDFLDAAHADRPQQLRALARAFQCRSERQSLIDSVDEDLDRPVSLLREAVDSPSCPRDPLSLSQLASALLHRFQRRHSVVDLEEAERLSREAVNLGSGSRPDHCISLHSLAAVLQSQFETTGLSEDIVEAIALHRKALDVFQQLSDQHYLPRSHYLLAGALRSRFERGGSLDDLNQSITSLQNALHLLSTHHPNHAQLLYSLAVALQVRFEKCGSTNDLDEAIKMHNTMLKLRSTPQDQPAFLEALAISLQSRFNQKGSKDNIRMVVALRRELVKFRPAPHPQHTQSLYGLVVAFQTYLSLHPKDLLFPKSWKKEYENRLQEALSIRATPNSTLDHVTLLNNHAYLVRLEVEEVRILIYYDVDVEDISEAMDSHRKALDLLPVHHPHRPFTLVRLADALGYQLKQHPSVEVLREAVSLYDEAMSLADTVDNIVRSSSLNPLAITGKGRLCRSRADLEEEIAYRREILCDLVQETSLYSDFGDGFPTHRSLAELDTTISFSRIILDLRQPPNKSYSFSLNSLAWMLYLRAEQRDTPGDADEAILLARKALESMPPGDLDRHHTLDTLSAALRSRSRLKQSPEGLDEAISLIQEAIVLEPSSDYYNTLTKALRLRFELLGSQADLDEAISMEEKAADAADTDSVSETCVIS